jgi:DNA-binding Xre family transcriptional regulator
MSKENPKNESKIKSKVRELAEKQGITSSYGLMKRLNVAPTVAVNLWNDDVTRFSVETLQLLCEKLMCEVGDLLVYEPNARRRKPVAAPESVKGESGKVKTEKTVEYKIPELDEGTKESFKQDMGWRNSALDIVQGSSDNETLLSSVQVAERLNVSRKSVNDYIIDGKLKATKGKQNHNFVTEADLQEFIKKSQLER